MPFDKLVAAVCPDAKLRRLVRNMIYDGVVAYLLEIELGEMEKALSRQLGKKQKALALNIAALKAGFDYAQEHFQTKAPFRVERMNATAGKILIEGNAAAAIGCLMAGVTVVAWYPITPSSSLCESLIDLLRKYRMDKADRSGDLRRRAGGRRDCRARHGHRRELGRRARDDVHVGPRHLADGRVHRPRLLRRESRR